MENVFIVICLVIKKRFDLDYLFLTSIHKSLDAIVEDIKLLLVKI